MIKTVIINNNPDSLNYLLTVLSNLKNIEVLGTFDDFGKIQNTILNMTELIIFDVEKDTLGRTLELIGKIKNINSKIKFIAQSNHLNTEIINGLKSKDIDELLLKPVLTVVLETYIKRVMSKNITNQKAKTVTLFSIKNAMGKTSTIVNLAYNITDLTNRKVCILDLHSNSFDAGDILNIKNKYNFKYVLDNIESLDKDELTNKISSYKNTNLYILSLFEDIEFLENFSKKDILKVFNALKNIFDYIFVDLSSTIDEKTVSILNNTDLIILVGLFDVQNIKNIQQCYDLFDRLGYNEFKIKLLINRTLKNNNDVFEKIKIFLDKKIDFEIPNNYLTLSDAVNCVSSVQETNPQSNIAKAYRQIANEILEIDFDKILKTNKIIDVELFDLIKRMGE